MSSVPQPPRTYNQNHAPRKYTPGKRRVSIYWTWSYPWEANRETTELDNRFSTMTEVRRVAWPGYEGTEWDEMHFLQGIAGTLELFHRSTLAFQSVAGEVTGHSVAVFQRIDQAGYKLPIDERILEDTDTLMVFGLDHLVSEQEASSGEIEAVREWLKREGTCLLLAPHHDVGFTEDLKQRQTGIYAPRRCARPAPAALRTIHAFAHESARRSSGESIRTSPCPRQRHKTNYAAHNQQRPG